MPTVGAPEIVFYKKQMFDAAKQPYPTDDWTFEDMRAAARKLTLDKNGRNADDPNFDAQNVVQWGWNNSPGYIWTNHLNTRFRRHDEGRKTKDEGLQLRIRRLSLAIRLGRATFEVLALAMRYNARSN